MSRGGIFWRGLLVAMLALAAGGCERVVSTTHFKATIRVDGRDYTSDVVVQMFSDDNRYSFSPYGRVLTFRLLDDRVVVLGTHSWGERLSCVPRLDQSDTGCKKRWYLPRMHLDPDGFIFNSATDPTSVEAFQFEPRDPEFGTNGRHGLRQGKLPIPVSNLVIEMVSYAAAPSQERSPRDTLDRDFPGYELTRNRDGKRIREINPALSAAASDVGVPLARDR